MIRGQPINVDRPTEEERDKEKGGDFYQECNKQVINKGYKKYRIYVHTSDIPFDGMFRAVYTVLDQDGKHLVLDFVQDVEQGKACTKAWNAAKLFVNSLKK